MRFRLKSSFSALMCSTITTTRKFFTVLVSIFSFHHAVSYVQWGAIGMVFTGLIIELKSEYHAKLHGTDHHHHHDAKHVEGSEAAEASKKQQ